MIKMTDIIKEGNLEIPSTNLLRWFLQRKDSTFVMFDTETTGLNNRDRTDQITQLAAIAAKFDLNSREYSVFIARSMSFSIGSQFITLAA